MSNRKSSVYLAGLAALASLLPLAVPSPVQAQGVRSTSCAGGYTSITCMTTWKRGRLNPNIIPVPGPRTEEEIAEAAARERGWLALCRPVIRQDSYGVMRYVYAAPGCEFGRYE